MAAPSTFSLGHFRGSNVGTFGQTISSRSDSSAHSLFSTSTPFGSPTGGSAFPEKLSSPFRSTSGFPGTTKFGEVASATRSENQFQGTAVASYSATPEVDDDGINSRYSTGKIKSISAMPVYVNKSHEELRLEDHVLHKGINQENAFQQSNSVWGHRTVSVPSSQFSFGSLTRFASGTATAATVSDSYVKPPYYCTSTTSGVSPSFKFGGSICDGNVNRDPRSAPNNFGVGFKSTPTSLHSESANGSTSSIAGISNMPSFTSANASSGLKTSIFGLPNTCVFEKPSASAFQVSTTPGFGITSTSSSWSTSTSVPSILSGPKSTCIIGAPRTSNFPASTASEFCFSSSGSQGTTTIESAASKQSQGSGVASYSATREVDRTNNKNSVEKIQSISAMPIFQSKSHEELRSEDYELRNKGGQTLWGGQFLDSSSFKTSDTQPNRIHSTQLSNQSFVNYPFQPLKCNLSAPKTGNFFAFNNTISKAPTLSPSVNPFSNTNLHSSQSQVFIPQPTAVSSVPTFTPNQNPSSLVPSSESMLANSCECPTAFLSPSIGTFSWSKPSVTLPPFIQSTSEHWPSILNASQPGQTAEKVDSLSTNDLAQAPLASKGLTKVMECSSHNINGQQTLSVQSSLVANPFAMESPIGQPNAVTSRRHGISSLPVSNNLSSNRRTSLLRIRHVSSRHPSLPPQRPSYQSCETKVPFFIGGEDGLAPIAPFLPRENPRAWVKNSMFLRSHSDGKPST